MNFEFKHSLSPSIPFKQQVLKNLLNILLIIILITLLSGIGMKLSSSNIKNSLESDHQRSQVYESLILQRNHLQEQLLTYELQPEPEVILILNDFLQNLATVLPEDAQLVDLRCEKNGKLILTGQVSDLASFQTLTKENINTFLSFESSTLSRIESSLYEFQLVYHFLDGDLVP